MKLQCREKRAREINHEDISVLKRKTTRNYINGSGIDGRQSPSLCQQEHQQQQDAAQQQQEEQRKVEGYRLSRWKKESLDFPANEESRVVSTEAAVCSCNAGSNAGGCCTPQDRRTEEEVVGAQVSSSSSILALKQLLLGYVLQDALRRRNEVRSSNHEDNWKMAWSILFNLRPQPEEGSSFTIHWLQAVMVVSGAMTPTNMQLHDTAVGINMEEDSISDVTDAFSTTSSISTLTASDRDTVPRAKGD